MSLDIYCLQSNTRYRGRDDLLLLRVPTASSWAALFTRNGCAAAPVQVARERLQAHQHGASLQALLINSGNANAATGARGYQDALDLCAAAAEILELAPEQILPCSTGIIGEYLPVSELSDCLRSGLNKPEARADWPRAARAIWTTDTKEKLIRESFVDGEQSYSLTGIAKGSGMIQPDMATMIAVLITDAAIPQTQLQQALAASAAASFNALSVDGDTSTNDSLVLIATGDSKAELSPEGSANFQLALEACCQRLALAIVQDGEGVKQVMRVKVEKARSVEEARAVAFSVVNSPLVKTALHAGDPNWGRIVAAVGKALVEDFQQSALQLALGSVPVLSDGCPAPSYREQLGAEQMRQPVVDITIELRRGDASFAALGCDLSAEYVAINSDYRS